MHLSPLEKKLLKDIYRHFPNVTDYTAEDKYPLASDCPLQTRSKIVESFTQNAPEQVDAALKRLVGLNLVRDVYLFLDDEVSHISLHAGKPVKMPIGKAGKGVSGYQVTAFGEATRKAFWDEWLKEQGKKFVESMAKEHGAKIVSVIGGFGLAVVLAWFGLDMRAWFGKEHPAAVQEQPSVPKIKPAY